MTKPKVLLTRRWPEAVEQRLAADYDLTVNDTDVPMDAAQLAAALRSQDAVCPTVSDAIDAAVLTAEPLRAKILGNYGVGVNHIDLAVCRARGLTVTNTPGVLTDATAELAITLMLMAARRAGEGERELRRGGWTGWRPTHLTGALVTGKTLGLIGFGRIGQAAARMAHHGFGMRILYHQRRRAAPPIEAETGARYCSTVEAVLAESDVVSLHMPGGAQTRHLIDRARLDRMKPTAFLVNTARGTVVDEAALAEALAQGRLAGAGLDVYEAEPDIHPDLLKLENVVLLPHLGSATLETRTAMGMQVADNLDAFFAGHRPPDCVTAD